MIGFDIEIGAGHVVERFRRLWHNAPKVSERRGMIMVINERELPRVLVCNCGWFHNIFPLVSSEKRFRGLLDSKKNYFAITLLQRACHVPKQSPKSLMISE